MTTIALIDDHKIFCDSLAGLINDFEGFKALWCAQDGRKAIQLLQDDNNLPDIILLDIVMPAMSGVEVAKWLFENKKEFKLNLEAESEMKLNQVIDVLISRSMKQGLAAEIYDLKKEPFQSGKVTKQEVPVNNGIKQEDAKKVVKLIKESGLKVQVAIMDDLVRVTAKKIDELQEVIQLSKSWNLGIALQYVNMK